MQSLLQIDQTGPTIELVLASLRRLRINTVGLEYGLQAEIAKQFTVDGIPFAKEHQLGPRNRIDFLVPGGIGVEIKKGKPNSVQVTAQVKRYTQFHQITTLVLVVERNDFSYNFGSNHKPVHLISLAKLWGLAL